jgi:hypothetical protein
MPRIGFSTGALAMGDFRRGLGLVRDAHLPVVELSSLRDTELVPLIDSLDSLPLDGLSYVSLHAPSRYARLSSVEMMQQLRRVVARKWRIIVHPDILCDLPEWHSIGEWLCLENMDNRKRIGRTADEMAEVFERLPDATFCFDIGHARQIDPTMGEAAEMLRRFGDRLRQVHMSEVDATCRHVPMSDAALAAFRTVAPLIPADVPIVLESMVSAKEMIAEVDRAQSLFADRAS